MLPKSNEFALADRETEGESEGCEAQLLRMFVRIFVLDYCSLLTAHSNYP